MATETDQVHDLLAVQTLTMPEGQANDLPPEPKIMSQAMASAESRHWDIALNAEMDGLIKNNL